MKGSIIAITTFVTLLASNCFANGSVKYKCINEDELNQLFLSANKDRRRIVEYFSKFPSTFSCFNELYGYEEDGEHYGELYSSSFEHIELLYESRKYVNGDDFYKKLIGLSVGGVWHADAVNYLKHILHKAMEEHPREFHAVISQEGKGRIKEFWNFYQYCPVKDLAVRK